METQFQTVTANVTAAPRYVKRNGEDYLVAPMTLIVPGVLAGSQGPLLYPPDEVQRHTPAWNDIPIVLGHPVNESGANISARSPGVLDKDGLGVVKRNTYNDKQQAEGWFNVKRLAAVDNRLQSEGKPGLKDRILRGEKIEISTGLFTENETEHGEYNGRAYTAIARNYKPDHLAVLVDTPGACSVNDGCGVNNQMVANGSFTPVENALWAVYNRDWPQSKRDKLSPDDFAGPGQSFPIKTQEDLDAACQSLGRAKNPDMVKAGIRRIAKRKGLKLPDTPTWNEGGTDGGEDDDEGTNNEQPRHQDNGQYLNQSGTSAKQTKAAADKGYGDTRSPAVLGPTDYDAGEEGEDDTVNPTEDTRNAAMPNEAHYATKEACAGSLMAEHPKAMQYGEQARQASTDGDYSMAADSHDKAAKQHEKAATEVRRGGEGNAAEHDNAAAMHRKAASMHRATVNALANNGGPGSGRKAGSGGADSKGEQAQKSGNASDHRQAAEMHKGAKEASMKAFAAAKTPAEKIKHSNDAAHHSEMEKFHSRKADSLQGTQNMKLTPTERQTIINGLTVNCHCDDRKVMNGLSDAALLQLKNNAKKKDDGEEDDDDGDDDMERNATGGKAEGSNADVTGEGGISKPMGGEGGPAGKGLKGNAAKQPKSITERLTPQELEVWNAAAAGRALQKRDIALRLTANVGDAAKREILVNRLMQKPLAELQEQLLYFPQQQTNRHAPAAPHFIGNGGAGDNPPPVTNHSDPDLLLDTPIINYAEIVAEQRNQGRKAS